MSVDIQKDLRAIDSIEQIPTILKVVCQVTGVGFAAVARVTEDRWVCLAVNDEIRFGLGRGGELKVETTLCHEVRQSRDPIVIDNVDEDETYCGHHTPAMYGLKSYISMPIFLNDGTFYGTLCAIDPKPRKLKNAGVIGMFELFAGLVAKEIDAQLRLTTTQANLSEAKNEVALREQFIAVLGHDLRNPLTAISSGLRLLERRPERSSELLPLMHKSIDRMASLISNLLDFARGRLGGGLTLTLSDEADVPLEPVLTQVVEELRIIHPGREIELDLDLKTEVRADRMRFAQLLSNLLGNALAHGSPTAPVIVKAKSDGAFELSVTNSGPQIPDEKIKELFLPFSRGSSKSEKNGLGLGLYIVSEIARAHGGSVTVSSDPQATSFVFRMTLPG